MSIFLGALGIGLTIFMSTLRTWIAWQSYRLGKTSKEHSPPPDKDGHVAR